MRQERFLLVRLFLVILITFMVTESRGDLHSSVVKYKNSTINRADIKKIARYDHLIRYFSSFSYFVPHHTVSPNFIRALILAESGANPSAISSKNALGLGQILLTTGREAASILATSKTHFRYVTHERLANLRAADLFDPAVNILLTCFLVAKYNYKFDGKIELVVSAWNAGEYTESLSHGQHAPFQETENLIGKVNAYYVYLLKQRIFR